MKETLSSRRKMTTDRCPLKEACYLRAVCDSRKANSSFLCKPIVLRKHEFLYDETGGNGNSYVIVNGLMVVQALSEESEPFVYAVFGRGRTVGEVQGFVSNSQNYIVSALTGCRLCKISTSGLAKLSGNSPEVVQGIINASCSNQGAIGQQVWVLSSPNLEERIQRQFTVLASYYYRPNLEMIEIRLSHEDISQLVNSSRTSVTHALQKIESKGFVKLEYRKIYLRSDVYCKATQGLNNPYTLWPTHENPFG